MSAYHEIELPVDGRLHERLVDEASLHFSGEYPDQSNNYFEDHDHDHDHHIECKQGHTCSPDCPDHTHAGQHEGAHKERAIEQKPIEHTCSVDCPEHSRHNHEHQAHGQHRIEHKQHICSADCPDHVHSHEINTGEQTLQTMFVLERAEHRCPVDHPEYKHAAHAYSDPNIQFELAVQGTRIWQEAEQAVLAQQSDQREPAVVRQNKGGLAPERQDKPPTAHDLPILHKEQLLPSVEVPVVTTEHADDAIEQAVNLPAMFMDTAMAEPSIIQTMGVESTEPTLTAPTQLPVRAPFLPHPVAKVNIVETPLILPAAPRHSDYTPTINDGLVTIDLQDVATKANERSPFDTIPAAQEMQTTLLARAEADPAYGEHLYVRLAELQMQAAAMPESLQDEAVRNLMAHIMDLCDIDTPLVIDAYQKRHASRAAAILLADMLELIGSDQRLWQGLAQSAKKSWLVSAVQAADLLGKLIIMMTGIRAPVLPCMAGEH